MLNSRRSCLTSPIVTDGRIYIPSTVSSGDEYILLLHSKYRTEISTKHFCLSAPVTIWQEPGRSSAGCQDRAVPRGGLCRPCAPHTPMWPWDTPPHSFPCTNQCGSLCALAVGRGLGLTPSLWPKDNPGTQCKLPI